MDDTQLSAEALLYFLKKYSHYQYIFLIINTLFMYINKQPSHPTKISPCIFKV